MKITSYPAATPDAAADALVAIVDGRVSITPTGWAAKFNTLGKNYTAAAAPTVNDDTTGGYAVWDKWYDTAGGEVYMCMDATEGAAVWEQVSLDAGDLASLFNAKADKTPPAADGNLAGLTATTGALEDSGITPGISASAFTLSGGTGTPRVLTIDGDLTASTVNTAVGKAHTQNTDTGTTSTTFQVDSGNTGPKVKNNSGVLEARNAADDAYADFAAKDITASGSVSVAASDLATQIIASMPAHYERSEAWDIKGYSTAADRYTLSLPKITVNVNDVGYTAAAADYDLSAEATWDTVAGTDYRVAATRAGKDFYVYACTPVSGTAPTIKISANSTVPDGYAADTSRKLGGFHCLCAAVGTIGSHTLTGFAQGDILPASIWDLKHRPVSSPEGMVYCDGADCWVDIYLTSGTGTSTASANGGTISVERDWLSFQDDYAAVSKRMLYDHEFKAAAAGSNTETNIAGSDDPVTTGGHSDTAGRRMISNCGCEDMCGVVWQCLAEQTFRLDGDDLKVVAASETLTITHAASPGGNAVYLKFGAEGNPYLACNMATDGADKWLTFNSNYTVLIKHEADPAGSGGVQVYFDEDATQPSRLLAATPGGKDVFIPTSNPRHYLKITYGAAPGTPGVAITYDDDADERLEFTSPTTTNGTLDLAELNYSSPGWDFYDLPGSIGSFYTQGSYGRAGVVVAGGAWYSGTHCGPGSRAADNGRWDTGSSLGGRGCARSQ